MKETFLICTFIIVFASCINQNREEQKSVSVKNDTLEVFRILFDSTLVGNYSPEGELNGELFRNNPFKDSIIILFDSLFLKIKPIHDSLKFKILTKDEICEVATKCMDQGKFCPDFLVIRHFNKTVTGYEIDLRFTCVRSNYKNGKLLFDPKTGELNSDTARCDFGNWCGRSIRMSIERTKEGLKGRITGIVLDG